MTCLCRIQLWYLARCNGRWEHEFGVSIDTLDNPDWCVTIDLNDTPWEFVEWNPFEFENGPLDWVNCRKEGPKFRGHGAPQKLEFVLEWFLERVEVKI